LSAEDSETPRCDKSGASWPGSRASGSLKQTRLIPDSILARVEEELKREHLRAENLQREMLYLQADFENYRKRVASEIEVRSTAETLSLLSDMLVIADQLELATRVAREGGGSKELADGLAMTLANLNKVMQAHGLTRIEAVGLQFDPTIHEAVEEVPRDDVPEGQVVEEIRSGYRFGEKVIRPSVVKVSCSIARSKEGGVELKDERK
jgi:molecular chaperone GrpE